MIEGIHGRIRYLGREGKPRKHKRGNWRIQKGILIRYKGYKEAKKRGRDI